MYQGISNGMNEVRVRFAPSPTGYFHIGSARTALYNWLYARGRNGKFILRIEDTDAARSTVSAIRSIINGLRFMGIDWDEGPALIKKSTGEDDIISKGNYGPYFQMKRTNFYRQTADRLLEEKKAYLCFCSQGELESHREKALLEGRGNIGYPGTCRELKRSQIDAFLAEGRKPVVRFRVPAGRRVIFNDIIRGEIAVESDEMSDFIILKADGIPTYNFACVCDDSMMKITDVIRGEDHISNTPKQILLYEALGLTPPNFAHLTMILDIDGSRLSKRKGARSLLEYENDGFIREAVVNYLALLGWGTKDSQNIFTLDELVSKFSLSRCTSASAIFDNKKLLWLNMMHIKNLTAEDIYRRAFSIIREAGLDIFQEEKIISAIALEKDKIKKLTDIPGRIDFLLKDGVEYEEEITLKASVAVGVLLKLKTVFESAESFTALAIERETREFAKREKIKTKDLFHPLRWAVSGRTFGPSLFEMCAFLGKDKVLARIEAFIKEFGEKS